MGAWSNDYWTPALATRLADVLTQHGAGHLREVVSLRRAVEARSPILAERAESAYTAAAQELRGNEDWSECRDAISQILAEANAV